MITYTYSHCTFWDWKNNYKIDPLDPLPDGYGLRFHLSSDFFKLVLINYEGIAGSELPFNNLFAVWVFSLSPPPPSHTP